jgi:16S rRNA U516 pseudouridylate synthase RsuA-like enzyme
VINCFEKEITVSVQFLGAYHYEKEYRVLIARHTVEEQLANWRRGVVLEDGYHTLG